MLMPFVSTLSIGLPGIGGERTAMGDEETAAAQPPADDDEQQPADAETQEAPEAPQQPTPPDPDDSGNDVGNIYHG